MITSVFEILGMAPHPNRKSFAHIQWLGGSPVVDKRELLLLGLQCDDVNLKHIVSKLNFELLSSAQNAPTSATALFARCVAHPRQ
jgi:hypothetical protein